MTIAQQLQLIQQQITTAEQKAHRKLGSVQLLAVSKHKSLESIKAAIAAGQTRFGENYLQEGLKKIAALNDSNLEWHFIGSIQTNKTKAIAEHFAWAHSIDRNDIAQRLNQYRPKQLPPLNVCIQVNISKQPSKSGVSLQVLPELAEQIKQLKQLRLRGLMAIPEPCDEPKQQIAVYQQVQAAQANLCKQGLELDTLSMGMSHDFYAAIIAGSTMVRIGTAIFGPRH